MKWIDETYSDQIYGITYTLSAAPTERKNKNDLLKAFNYAFQHDFKSKNLEIINVTDTHVIYKVIIEIPHHLIPDKKVDIYYIVQATFQPQDGKWKKSIFRQYNPG